MVSSPARQTSGNLATDPESWFAAEEEALKDLEAQVAAKRKEKRMAFARSARQQAGDGLKDEDDLLQTSPIRSPVKPLSSSGRLALRSSQSASSRSPITPERSAVDDATTPSPTRRTPGVGRASATPSRRVASGSNETLARTPATINKDTVRSQQALSASQSKPAAIGGASTSSLRDSTARKPGGGGLSRTFLGKRLMERTAAAAAAATSAKKDQEARRHAAEERSPVRAAVQRGDASVDTSPARPARADSGEHDDTSIDRSQTGHDANASTSDEIDASAEQQSTTADESAQVVELEPIAGVGSSPAKTPSAHQRKQVEGIEIRSEVRTATVSS